MSYERQTFIDHETVITAAHLQHIEDGIVRAFESIPTLKLRTVTLSASKWVGSDGIFSQVVTIDGVTANSKVDLLPSAEQLVLFYDKDVSLVTENEDGVVTVFAIGDKLTNDYTMQVQITEVVV